MGLLKIGTRRGGAGHLDDRHLCVSSLWLHGPDPIWCAPRETPYLPCVTTAKNSRAGRQRSVSTISTVSTVSTISTVSNVGATSASSCNADLPLITVLSQADPFSLNFNEPIHATSGTTSGEASGILHFRWDSRQHSCTVAGALWVH